MQFMTRAMDDFEFMILDRFTSSFRILRQFWQIVLTFAIQATLANWSQNYAKPKPFRNRRPYRTPPGPLRGW